MNSIESESGIDFCLRDLAIASERISTIPWPGASTLEKLTAKLSPKSIRFNYRLAMLQMYQHSERAYNILISLGLPELPEDYQHRHRKDTD